jgi:hypothetical protein
MKSNVFPVKEIQERIEYLKNNPRKLGKIPSLTQCIAEFIQTEKGKQCIMDYIIEQDAFNHKLIKEIENYGK